MRFGRLEEFQVLLVGCPGAPDGQDPFLKQAWSDEILIPTVNLRAQRDVRLANEAREMISPELDCSADGDRRIL